MPRISLTDQEELAVRKLAELVHDGRSEVERTELIGFLGGNEEESLKSIARLVNYQLIDGNPLGYRWRIDIHYVIEAVDQWDNPSKPDYWASTVAWFRSKWWSIPLFLLGVGLPLLIQWVEMLERLLAWFSEP